MDRLLKRVRAIFEFELDVSFPFPSAEAVFMTLTTLTSLLIIQQGFKIGFLINPTSQWVSEIELDRVSEYVRQAALYSLGMPLVSMTVLLMALIPLLSAFRVAGQLENDMFRITLSYPIKRLHLLILKAMQITLITCVPITLSVFVILSLYNSLSIGIGVIVILIAFWSLFFAILSTSFVLSIIAGSSAKSAIGGMALWFTLLGVSLFTHFPTVLRGTLNPVNLAMYFFTNRNMFGYQFTEVVFMDVLVSIIGSFLLGLVTFLLSIRLFERVEL
ncbi:hypothetical protein EU537_06070 [Candidatus Thorarchaeota archaeon]|nr:MAG: hypothetical protein EU537_06070 [Candidatus Thorarchaeota archaeon]